LLTKLTARCVHVAFEFITFCIKEGFDFGAAPVAVDDIACPTTAQKLFFEASVDIFNFVNRLLL